MLGEHAVHEQPAPLGAVGGGVHRLLLGRGVRQEVAAQPRGQVLAGVRRHPRVPALDRGEQLLDERVQLSGHLGVVLLDGGRRAGVGLVRGDGQRVHLESLRLASTTSCGGLRSGGDDLLVLGDGHDEALAGSGNDTVRGGAGRDEIRAGLGHDLVFAGPGRDVVTGGQGPDAVGGGDGDDMLMGDDSEDILYGRDGDDYLIGGAGADLLYGGPGDDILTDWQPTSLDATAPDDADVLRGGAGADFAGLSQGADHVFLGDGDDVVKLADDGAVDEIDCGAGLDTVTYYGAIDPLDVLIDCEEIVLAE